MVDYTTVKIDKTTLRLLIQFKALIERITGISVTFDVAIKFATMIADWKLSYDMGHTKKSFEKHRDEMLKRAKAKDENIEIYSILEELDAFKMNWLCPRGIDVGATESESEGWG